MNKLLKSILISLVLLTLLFSNNSKASHIIGGELFYRCIDEDLHLYEFGVKLYIGCTGAEFAYFDDPIYVAVYDSLENAYPSSPFSPIVEFSMSLPPTDTIENETYSQCYFLSNPSGVCIVEAIYTSTNVLPDKVGGYYMTYQRCCRNAIIANIADPGGVGASWNLSITEDAIAACNSSPVFKNYVPTFVCVNERFEYDHSAIDYDGDSLVYELCEASTYNYNTYGIVADPSIPLSYEFIVPYDTVAGSKYSGKYPMYAPDDSLKIDSQTGELTVTSSKKGTYVVTVCVSEYRNGKLLSTNKRDLQYTVFSCAKDTLTIDYDYSIRMDSLTFEFYDKSSATNDDIDSWQWDFGDGDTSNIQNTTHTFPDTGTYNVCLTAGLYGCIDSICKQIKIRTNATSLKEYEANNFNFEVYPNPFNSTIHVSYQLNKPTVVKIELYDLLGRELETYLDDEQNSGKHSLRLQIGEGRLEFITVLKVTIGERNYFTKLIKM